MKEKRFLVLVLVLTMVMSCFGSMSAIALTKTELVYNAPVVNDSYEDGTTPTFAWTKANSYSAIVSGTGHNKGSFVDPGSKYMNFFSNAVTQATLEANGDKNVNSISGLKAYMTGDINYISFDIASAWVTRDMVAFLDSNSTAKSGNLPALLFNAKGKYCAGKHGNLHPWYYTLTQGFLNNDYSSTLGSVSASYKAMEWYNVKFVVDNTSDTNNVSVYVNNSLVNTMSYADSENYDSLIIKDYKAYSSLTAGFGIDNVQVGTVSKVTATVPGDPVNVTSAEISDNGALTLVFDGEVDGATLTADTVKVVMNGVAAAYTNAVYDAEAKTWSATISDFNPFYSVKVSVSGAKGTDDNSVVDFEKIFAGKDFVLNPVLDENFDDGEIENTNWGNKWITETFDDVSGRGKVWTIPFGVNMAASAVSGELSGLGQYMTGDVNYIKFDFSTTNCYNFTFAPLPAGTYTHYLNLSTSILGWMYANSFDVVNTTGLNNSQDVLDTNTKDAINRGADWRRGAEAVDYVAGKWYTVTYILDKSEGKIKLYLDDVFQYEVSVSADILDTIDRVYIWNHKSTKDSTVSRHMSLDNLEVGTVTKAKASDFVLTNGAVNGTTITGVKEAKYFDETKGKEVRRFNFDKKEYGTRTNGSTDVRASLDGFKKFMTDENVNTICFDYKIMGTSSGHIGLFLAKSVNDYANKQSTGILLNNSQGILVRAFGNWNQAYSDWYAHINYNPQTLTNNREWNRIILEVNNKNGEVTVYVNGEYYTTCANVTAPANPPIDMDSICFQTAGEVANDGDLAILMDNIVAYPGTAKADEFPFSVEVDGIYDSQGLTEIETPDFITASSTINANVKYNNNAESEKKITFIAGYYDAEGRIVYSDVEILTLPGVTGTETMVEFTTPDDVSGVSAIKVFVWDNIFSLNPVGRVYFIYDDEWRASGKLGEHSAYNLVTTFYDEETTRGFAWSAVTEHRDMAIRYAPSDAQWYGESIVEDAEYEEYEGLLYYKVNISNLEPGETYLYRIGDKCDDVWSDFYTFTTEPENLTEFSFIGVTDPQSSGWSGGHEYYKAVLDKAFKDDSDAAFMVNLGDMVEDGTAQSQWNSYFKAVKGYAESIPHMAVVGNHETRGDSNTAVKKFTLLFNNPKNGADALGDLTASSVSHKCSKGVVNNIEGTVYSFDYGDAHFAVLNSGTDWSESGSDSDKAIIMTEQAKWLDKDLEASDKKWKIVMVHISMYPAKTERFDIRDELTEIIDKHGVDLVLSGHDHMVTRTYPMKNGEIVTTSSSASVAKGTGMINAILGVAGPKRYAEVSEIPSYMAFLKATVNTQPTYSLFDVNDERISVITKQVDGTVVDSFEIVDR